MRILLRPRNLIAPAHYLVLSCCALVPLAVGPAVSRIRPSWRASSFCLDRRLGRLQAPGVFPLAAAAGLPGAAGRALPVCLYYGQGISTHHLGIIAETSPHGGDGIPRAQGLAAAGVMVGVVAWWAGSWRAALAHPRPRLERPLALLVCWCWPAGPVACSPTAHTFGIAPPAGRRRRRAAPGSAAKSSGQRSKSPSRRARDSVAAAPVEEDAAAPPARRCRTGRSLPLRPGRLCPVLALRPGGARLDFYKERVYLADLNRRSAASASAPCPPTRRHRRTWS
jgi:hypothetical protein